MAVINLGTLHDRMKKALQVSKIAEEKKRAQEMEKVLRALKSQRKIADLNIQDGSISGEILMAIRKEAVKSLNPKARSKIFKTPHSRVGNFEDTDDIVEAELGAVLAAIQNQASGSTLTYKDFVAGRDPATVYSKEITEKTAKRTGNRLQREASKKIPEATFSARSQKIDVNGIAITNLNITIDPNYERLVELFSNVTFSIKNYASVFETDTLSLGTTKPDKAIRGALYYLGYRRNFNAVVAALSTDEGIEHAQHLQFAYELAGWGQGTGIGKNFTVLPNVDYLIYNDPSVPESIAVRSVKAIIYDKIEGNVAMGGTRSILKSYFNMKESNYKIQLHKKKS